MKREEFFATVEDFSSSLGIEFLVEQKEKLYIYMQLLLEWNEKINLTAIVKPKEIILKHFIDSITISKYIKKNSLVADVGTGAGFPGIPLKILREDLNIALVDSLNKRINFLNEVIEKLKLSNIKAVHARAEDIGKSKEYREKFDVVTSRAVANLSTLSEYLMPLAKVNGKCLAMKGPGVQEEIENAKKAINVLGGTIQNIVEFKLPNSNIERTIVEINKVKNTDKKYPRKAGIPSKEPL